MKKFWIRKGLMVTAFVITAILIFSLVVMGLWNTVLAPVIGVKSIGFMQALGILVLSKILFGGFRGGWRGGRGPEWRQKMKEKWEAMSPAEREQFKAEWKHRCGGRWSMNKPMEEQSKSTN